MSFIEYTTVMLQNLGTVICSTPTGTNDAFIHTFANEAAGTSKLQDRYYKTLHTYPVHVLCLNSLIFRQVSGPIITTT